MITLRNPLTLSCIGLKSHQEDYIFPEAPTADSRVFIVCDGMGGHERGEIASHTVATALGVSLDRDITEHISINAERFDRSLAITYDALDTIGITDPGRKPGTTLTCLCFNDDSFLAAHIGDSRIYQIRPALYSPEDPLRAIIYRSEDHSLVNDMVRAGRITPAQARNHPQRNIITRALQPGPTPRFPATIHESTDICAGDFFLLCSDGILEKLDESELCAILSNAALSDTDKLRQIKEICDNGTRDNYSACLIPVDQVSAQHRSRALLIAATAIMILAAMFGALYFFNLIPGCNRQLVAPTDTLVNITDSVHVTDTIIPDTILTLATDTIVKTDSVATTLSSNPEPEPAATPEPVAEPESDTAVQQHNLPAIRTQEQPAATPPAHAPASADPKAVPARPQKDNSGAVPKRNKKQSPSPKPLA